MFRDTTNFTRALIGRRSRTAVFAAALLAGTTYVAYADPLPALPPGLINSFIDPILSGPPEKVWPTLEGLIKGVSPTFYAALDGPFTALNNQDPTLIGGLIKASLPLLSPTTVTVDDLAGLINKIIPYAAPGKPLNPLIQKGGFLDVTLQNPLFGPALAPGGIVSQAFGPGGPLSSVIAPGGLLADLAASGEPLAQFLPPPVVATPVNTPPPDTTKPTPVDTKPVVAPPTTVALPPVVTAPVVPLSTTYGAGETVDAAKIKPGPITTDGATIVFSKPSTLSNAITAAASGLTVDTEANGTLAGVISGPGGLTKIGNATLTLSATNTYSGDTDVKAGLLNNYGTLANTMIIVENGATLGGSGTAYGVHAKPGGTISPGQSIGTLHFGTGGVQMDAGSIYHVEIANDGRSDKIVTQGVASINGAKLVITKEFSTAALQLADLKNINQTYDILDAAGGIKGKFDTSSLPSYLFFGVNVDYSSSTSVLLSIGRNDTTFASVGVTRNEKSVGAGIQALGNGNAIYDLVLSSTSSDDARTVEHQLAGEIHGDVLGGVLDDSAMIRNAVIDRLNNRNPEGPSFWMKAIDSFGSTGTDGNASKVKRQTDGVSLGVDTSLGGTWLAGVAGNYEATPLQTKGMGSATINSYHFALYTGGDVQGLSLHLGGAYGHYTANTVRAIPVLASAEHGHESADQTQIFGEVGYPITMGDTTVEPFADVSYTDAHLATFAESEGPAALQARGQSLDRTQSILGARYQVAFRDNETIFTPNVTLGWVHNFSGTTPALRMGFVDDPNGNTFTVDGVSTNADAAMIRAGLDAAIGSGFSLGVGYEGQIGERTQDHAVRLSIRVVY